MKLALAISSLLTLILLVGAAVQENYFTEWRKIQREYKTILLAKARDEGEKRIARRYSVELRQIVVPDLDTADRCVSCHVGTDDPRMTGVAEPFACHPGPFLDDHDVDKFGCTICHGGQGRATTKEEAHANRREVFWERPILSPTLIQSSCGICHDPDHLKNNHAPLLAQGAELFREQGCLGCHKLGERGGTLGPPLETIGDKGRHSFPFARIEGERTVANWHREHLKEPQKVVPESKMPKPDLTEEKIEALVTYLLSLRKMNLTEPFVPRDKYEERYLVWHPKPLTGIELYRQFCKSCHGEATETVMHPSLGRMMPAIRNPAFLEVVSDDFLFNNIHDGRPGTEMSAWGQPAGSLSDEEIRRIVDYLLEARGEKKKTTFVLSKSANPENGRKLFEANCTSCHTISGGGGNAPWLGSPGFQETYTDPPIGHTIKYGREGTLMAPYGKEAGGELTDQEISDLVVFIRTL